MRLVDADELVIKLRDLADKNNDNLQRYLALIAAVILINEQPIAYDIEKVVAELEEEKEIVKEYEKYHCSVRLDKAIDIVRKGGNSNE